MNDGPFTAAIGVQNNCLRFPGLVLSALLASVLCLGIPPLQAASASAEQNWPQWRGPLQNGVAPRANPPTEWSETKNVKWKIKLPGEGTATPIIWDDKVFVLAAIPTGKKVESKAAEPGDQASPPPGGPPAGAGRPPAFRGGPGGPGRPGGCGPGNFLGERMLSAGDKNSDGKLSR